MENKTSELFKGAFIGVYDSKGVEIHNGDAVKVVCPIVKAGETAYEHTSTVKYRVSPACFYVDGFLGTSFRYFRTIEVIKD